MENSINQEVILFTANYVGQKPDTINDLTTYDSIGISTQEDLVQYLIEIEDSFGLEYEQRDSEGIVVVGNTTELILRKLGQSKI